MNIHDSSNDQDERREVEKADEVEKVEKVGKRKRPGVLCDMLGLGGVFFGGTVGLVGGFPLGFADAVRLKIGKPDMMKHVLDVSISTGINSAGFIGTYAASYCFLKHYRGRHDFKTVGIAGFAAGTVASLRTRSLPKVLLCGLASAGTFAALCDQVNTTYF